MDHYSVLIRKHRSTTPNHYVIARGNGSELLRMHGIDSEQDPYHLLITDDDRISILGLTGLVKSYFQGSFDNRLVHVWCGQPDAGAHAPIPLVPRAPLPRLPADRLGFLQRRGQRYVRTFADACQLGERL